mmetsp:Transcript_46634/g.143787  ORF Transcript_46634/g.143787 Transcript_46634/m.143787 type:complete len:250 (+) Transcript_46634:849-1598(+)
MAQRGPPLAVRVLAVLEKHRRRRRRPFPAILHRATARRGREARGAARCADQRRQGGPCQRGDPHAARRGVPRGDPGDRRVALCRGRRRRRRRHSVAQAGEALCGRGGGGRAGRRLVRVARARKEQVRGAAARRRRGRQAQRCQDRGRRAAHLDGELRGRQRDQALGGQKEARRRRARTVAASVRRTRHGYDQNHTARPLQHALPPTACTLLVADDSLGPCGLREVTDSAAWGLGGEDTHRKRNQPIIDK